MDGFCNEECNTYACDFDGNDCSLGINPWLNCTASINCWEVFMDGFCNEECNNAACLFDGRDCEKKLQPCNPIYDAYCQKHYANGFCDYGCNNAECNWDGLDCENEKEPAQLAEGAISIILLMDAATFRLNAIQFLRDLGHQLRTTVRIKKNAAGMEMIYPWKGGTALQGLTDSEFGRKHHVVYTETRQIGIQVYLELDNRKCIGMSGAECFGTANEAAEFLAATASKHSLSKQFPIYQVKGVNPDDDGLPGATNVNYVLVGFFGLLLMVLVTVLVVNRKRAHGITWFPEGFFTANTNVRRPSRRRPDGQEMRNLNKNCEDGVNQFICHCPPGYGGRRCEIDIDECGSNPCQHGGICRDGLNAYTCQCMPGYTGRNCEINIDDCVNNPCRNGGSCIDLVNGYKCVCRGPFTGRDCESKMDPCQPNRCRNGAKCSPSPNYLDFACSCTLGYTGRLCDEDINECALSIFCLFS